MSFLRHIAATCLGSLLIGVTALAGCSTDTTTDTTTTSDGGGFSITITSPKASENALAVHGTIEVKGTIKPDAGVKLTGVAANIGDAAGTCTLTGTAFTCTVDSTDQKNGKPRFKCNQGTSITIIASGTFQGSGASSSASLSVEVDNCLPTAEIIAPVDGGSFVGKTQVVARLRDAKLTSGELTIIDEDGNSLLDPGAPFTLPSVAGVPQTDWRIHTNLDTSLLAKTRHITITLKGADAVGNEVEAVANVISIKRPLFLGNSDDADQFVAAQQLTDTGTFAQIFELVNDVAFASPANAPNGFVSFTQDPTPSANDALTDVVLGTGNGVFVRAGLPRTDALGRPIDKAGTVLTGDDAASFVHSLHFENVDAVSSPFAKFRIIRSPQNTNILKVFLLDFDNDGDLDIVALGYTGSGGVAWAALNVPGTLTRKDANGGSVTYTIRAFKLAQVLQLPAVPLSGALADLNNDGQLDLVVGSATQGVGLMTVPLLATPLCTLKASDGTLTQDTCNTDAGPDAFTWDQLKSASVFDTNVSVALHKGVSGISSIAIGDFWTDTAHLPDVCVGEANRPLISCYRNRLGTGVLDQATLAYDFGEGSDTARIVTVDYTSEGATKKDGPDLLVASIGGEWVRWLKGNNAGKFSFVEDPTTPARAIKGQTPVSLAVGKVGPKGETYAIATFSGREVTTFPVSTSDGELARACYRAWIGGESVSDAGAVDVDGDGVLDLWALDSARPGVTVLLGQTDANHKFVDNFIGPDVHHLCGVDDKGNYGPETLQFSGIADFGKDKKQELVLAMMASSLTWTVGIFDNTTGRVAPEPRQGILEPKEDSGPAPGGAGLSTEKPSFTMGDVTAGRLGDVTGDGVPDLVLTRGGTTYSVGPITATPPCKCLASIDNEIDNWFGDDSPAGTDITSGNPRCCGNFYADDTERLNPLHGYGDGAPLVRASAFVFTSDNSGPLKIGKPCPANQPCHMVPAYAFSAGREPVDVHLVDINADQKLDIVTVMDGFGPTCYDPETQTPEHVAHAEPRMRIFQNTGGGKFQKTFFTGAGKDVIKLGVCGEDSIIPLPVQVSYRVVPGKPTMVRSGPWPNATTGAIDAATLFVLGQEYGLGAVFGHLDKFNFQAAYTRQLGADVRGFGVRDVNGDGLADILALLGGDISYLYGVKEADGKSATFPTKDTIVEKAQQATWLDLGDVNADGVQDIVLLDPNKAAVRVYLGTGRKPGEVGEAFQLYEGAFNGAFGAVDTALADMDGDTCLDVVIRSKYGATVLHNESGGCSGALQSAHLNQ